MRSVYIGLLIVLVFSSCNSKETLDTNYDVIDITSNTEIKLSELARLTDLIPLEVNPESILPARGKLWPTERGFFFSGSRYRFPDVLYFDENGKFVTKIGSPGNGPGEFTSCYNLIDLGDTIAIYDQRKKFSFFLRTGEFTKDINLGEKHISAAGIHPTNRDIYLLTGTREYDIYRLNRFTLAEVDSFMPNPVIEESMSNSFYPVEGGRLFFQNRSNLRLNIYEITNTLVHRYHIKTGADMSQYSEDDPDSWRFFLEPGRLMWTLRGFLENSDWVYLFLRSDIRAEKTFEYHYYLYDKNRKTVYHLPGSREKDDIFGPAFRLDKENRLFFTYDPDQMLEKSEWIERCEQLKIQLSLDQNTFVITVDLNQL